MVIHLTWHRLTHLFLLLFLTTFAALLLAVLHPDLRISMRNTLNPEFRTVLSTTQFDFAKTGQPLKIVKVKTRDQLSLEIYGPEINGYAPLLNKISMGDRRDAYFNFNGEATNLAVDDINGDGSPEVIAPNLDRDLVGRLNVYQYEASTQNLVLMNN